MKYREESFELENVTLEEIIEKINRRYKHTYIHYGTETFVLVIFRNNRLGGTTVVIIVEDHPNSKYINVIGQNFGPFSNDTLYQNIVDLFRGRIHDLDTLK